MSSLNIIETKDWAKQIIDLYKDGASDAEVAADMRVTIKEYYNQVANNTSFAQLVEYGRTLSQAFWEKQARQNIGNKGFNTPLWAFYMKNKFGWADKTENLNTEANTNIDIDSLREEVAKKALKYSRLHSPELKDAQRILRSVQTDVEDESV